LKRQKAEVEARKMIAEQKANELERKIEKLSRTKDQETAHRNHLNIVIATTLLAEAKKNPKIYDTYISIYKELVKSAQLAVTANDIQANKTKLADYSDILEIFESGKRASAVKKPEAVKPAVPASDVKKPVTPATGGLFNK
jgi:DNA-binding FadR family transcriptional regulator